MTRMATVTLKELTDLIKDRERYREALEAAHATLRSVRRDPNYPVTDAIARAERALYADEGAGA